jgi:uncharacterized cofD-like protein
MHNRRDGRSWLRWLAGWPRVVAFGGGHGLPALLRGLRQFTSQITACVCVTDDGGSSGKLRSGRFILPPGDIRNCLVALSDSETSLPEILQHRFRPAGDELSAHDLGNLFLAALAERHDGDLSRGAKEAGRLLHVHGQVLPITLDKADLVAEMEDGSVIRGEVAMVESPLRIHKVSLDPSNVEPLVEAITAIYSADLIVAGPGSLYSSTLPPLLVPGIPEAIQESSARAVFVVNTSTQRGETDGFSAADHVRVLERHLPCQAFDTVIVNRYLAHPSDTSLQSAADPLVVADCGSIRELGYTVVERDVLNATGRGHDPVGLAEVVLSLALWR